MLVLLKFSGSAKVAHKIFTLATFLHFNAVLQFYKFNYPDCFKDETELNHEISPGKIFRGSRKCKVQC